jgi:hypothetical protein
VIIFVVVCQFFSLCTLWLRVLPIGSLHIHVNLFVSTWITFVSTGVLRILSLPCKMEMACLGPSITAGNMPSVAGVVGSGMISSADKRMLVVPER